MDNIIVKSFKANGKIHRSWYNIFKVEEINEGEEREKCKCQGNHNQGNDVGGGKY